MVPCGVPSDVEGFNLDRGMVLYPSDGGTFKNIRWERVRFSSFFSYTDEGKEGAVFDFESKHRSGLSQLVNVTASEIDSVATLLVLASSSLFRSLHRKSLLIQRWKKPTPCCHESSTVNT